MEGKSALRPVVTAVWVVGACLVCGIALAAAGAPAPYLIGAIVCSALLRMAELQAPISAPVFKGAQCVIGVMIADRIASGFSMDVAQYIPLFSLVSLVTLGLCGVLGVCIARMGVIPGTSAIWGVSPGAATAMVIMAEDYGADRRIVSLMQYTRVLFVTLTSAMVVGGVPVQGLDELGESLLQVNVPSTAAGLIVALGGFVLARYIKFPAGHLLYSMALGVLTVKLFHVDILPAPLLLLAAYVILGCKIGGGYSRGLLVQFKAIMRRLVGSILLLIVISLIAAWMLHATFGIPFATSYLALSPGGLDTAAIIGASSDVDMHIVMVSQTLRMLLVTLLGPVMVRYLSQKFVAEQGSGKLQH